MKELYDVRKHVLLDHVFNIVDNLGDAAVMRNNHRKSILGIVGLVQRLHGTLQIVHSLVNHVDKRNVGIDFVMQASAIDTCDGFYICLSLIYLGGR